MTVLTCLLSRTCRARHVKCDERKPICRQCAKKGRNCHYDRHPQTQGSTPAAAFSGFRPQENTTTKISIRDIISVTYTDGDLDRGRLVERQTADYSSNDFNGLHCSRYDPGQTLTPTSSQASPFANLASILSSADWDHEDRESQAPTVFRTDEPIQLAGIEVTIFRNYVNRVAHWVCPRSLMLM